MEPSQSQLSFTSDEATTGQRVDVFLAACSGELSRNRIKTLAADKHVRCDGEVVRSMSRKVKMGELYTIDIPPTEEMLLTPIDMSLDVLFEDEHMLVVNKPVGLTVHPAPGNYDYTLVHGLLHHCGDSLSGIGGVARPGIVHRLDKDTSGLMVVAKHDQAHQFLAEQLKDRSLSRRYVTFVWGKPVPENGVVDAPIGRSQRDRKKMAVLPTGGRDARTHYWTIESHLLAVDRKRGENIFISQVECKLESGRTHQIRVHMAHVRCSLVGDPAYGNDGLTARVIKAGGKAVSVELSEKLEQFSRQALHAREIGFIHPASEEKMTFSCPLPEDMTTLWQTVVGDK